MKLSHYLGQLHFILVRTALMLAIYLSQLFPQAARPSLAVGGGGAVWRHHLRQFLLNWARWDSSWYLTVIKQGYSVLFFTVQIIFMLAWSRSFWVQ